MVKKLQIAVDSPGYYGGSVVSGNLTVTVDKPKKYKLIKVDLVGKAEVEWTERDADNKKIIHKNNENFFQLSCIVWERQDAPNGELASGTHNFRFQFSLPHGLPPTFERQIGQIRYYVRGKIQKGALKFAKSTSPVSISIYQPPLNIRDATLVLPLHYEKEKDAKILFGASQLLKFSFDLPRTAFSKGEAVPLVVSVLNQSSKSVRLVASIKQNELYYSRGTSAYGGEKEKRIFSKVVSARSEQIEAKCMKTWKANLTIPLSVMPTIDNYTYCKCIRVSFTLKVKMKVPWATNMSMTIPLTIYDSCVQNPVPETLQSPPVPPVLRQEFAYSSQQSAGMQSHQYAYGSPPIAAYQQSQQFGTQNVLPPHGQSSMHPLHPQQMHYYQSPSVATQQQFCQPPSMHPQQFGGLPPGQSGHPLQQIMGSGPPVMPHQHQYPQFGPAFQPMQQFGSVPQAHTHLQEANIQPGMSYPSQYSAVVAPTAQSTHSYPYSHQGIPLTDPPAYEEVPKSQKMIGMSSEVGSEHTQQRNPLKMEKVDQSTTQPQTEYGATASAAPFFVQQSYDTSYTKQCN